MPIEQDGKKYYDGDEINDIVRARLDKAAEKRRAIESERDDLAKRWEEAQPQLSAAEALARRTQELEAQLAQSQGSLKRYQAATTYGVTDADTIEALEFAHSKLGDDAPDFAEYLAKAAEDASVLPTYLRGVLQPGESEQREPIEDKQEQTQRRVGTKPPRRAPKTTSAEDFRHRAGEADSWEKLQELANERRAR